jgi:flagellar P-ring protein FlgI
MNIGIINASVRTIPLVLVCCLGSTRQALASDTRLKELVTLEGVRDNQLTGYGLVVGLNGTGDRRQTVFSVQSLTNLLQQMGVSVSPAQIRVSNTAAVIVTATLPPFAQPGSRIDVTLGAIGDATNLQGGLLVLTSLKGPDGRVYAMSQGPVVTGGFVAGKSGNNQVVNHPTVGRIPAGALVEQASPAVAPKDLVRLQLRSADFTTAVRVSSVINKKFATSAAQPIAKADNSALVTVRIPLGYANRESEFIAGLETLAVETDRVSKVVINERTGTIVMGKEVRVSPVAIMHGSLTVEIQTSFDVSQPAPMSGGKTTVTPQVGVGVKEEKARNIVLSQGATVEELAQSMNAIGATARDIIAVLQNLRSAGALEAEIEVI